MVEANILQPIIDVAEWVFLFFHNKVGLGWGASIIALTVAVRIVLIPLTLKQFKSMQELQKYGPQLKELQKKYKDDRQRLQQETMKFYQEHKINPLGSCLPLLAQFPVFISLFYLLRNDLKPHVCPEKVGEHIDYLKVTCQQVDPGSAKFLFIPDITAKATGGVLLTLAILYVGSQLLSSMVTATSTMDPKQRRIMMALPLVFVIFIINFPAGLVVYWITTNIWTILQQLVVKRTIGHKEEVQAVTATSDLSAGSSSSSDKKAPPLPPGKRKKRSGKRR